MIATGDKYISIEREYRSYGWRSTDTGRFIVVVDQGVGERARRFPPKADGSYNYEKIADALKSFITRQVAAAKIRFETEKRKAASDEIMKRLAAEFDASKLAVSIDHWLPRGGGRSEYRQSVASDGKVFVKLGNLDCTEEQARIMLEAYARAFPKSS